MKLLWRKLKMIPHTVLPGWECPYALWLQFLYYWYVHSQLCSHNLPNMVHYNYLVLFTSLCCPLDAGFCLWENAVGELELLSGQKFPHRKWRKPCISTFKRTQQNISQRQSHSRLYGPLHVYHLPATEPRGQGGRHGPIVPQNMKIWFFSHQKIVTVCLP